MIGTQSLLHFPQRLFSSVSAGEQICVKHHVAMVLLKGFNILHSNTKR